MYETESRFLDESAEPIPIGGGVEQKDPPASLAVRRRIERLRELHRLRKLLDDPDFDDLS
ncbi:PA3496 family putative envelope integrity protein [Thiococcus pfennigii]|jgi:hypothetical protein|uniref:PA3496 family putative envelope integrity protein n=1 Tax=Thiococcus pfennigii TaxID=1057 RepID=UPI0019073284|nr:hypothetical protein [Thiococcus pfennigii]MBK1700859.1 hypothetical protein [Thiococcus pfennigii]MBK1730474.1 hypothetical protein [Thiococcus pfennigii]